MYEKHKCKHCQRTRWVLTAMILIIVLTVFFLGIESSEIVVPDTNSSKGLNVIE